MRAWLLRQYDRLAARAAFQAVKHVQGDIVSFARLKATMDTAAYYEAHVCGAEAVGSRAELLAFAARVAPPDGLALEFGVATGWSINRLAGLVPERRVYGFDSFDGLPEAWGPLEKGAFAQSVPNVASNVELVVGLFEATLPAFVAAHPGPVSLLHVDCDLYRSAATIFRLLGDAIGPGAVIVFDEYWNYPGWRQHEHRAFQEFVAERGLRYRYAAFVPTHQQVCVVIE
jgi:hypothetical protein